MKNIVIVGTSGVGKTFLEQELELNGLSFQLPKYTNRPSRPGENSNKTICVSPAEFENLFEDDIFFFILEYSGFRYGWKRADLLIYPHIPSTLAITLESLSGFISRNPSFFSVLLTVDNANLKLIEKRLYIRENYSLLSPDRQIEVKVKIDHRLDLARKELNQIINYKKIVTDYSGMVFTIKDDQTVFDEIIPKIRKSFK